jgi:O-antigen ligase
MCLEKTSTFLPTVFIVLLVFFIPVSSSVKSILMLPCILAILFTSSYRQYLPYALKTPWACIALILFLDVLLACFWSEAPLSLRFNGTDKYAKLLLLPIFAVGFINPNTRTWVLNSYIGAMLLTCILSLLKFTHLLTLNTSDPGEVFYNHIVTGFMMALAIYFSAILISKTKSSRMERTFHLIMIALGSFQIFFVNTGRTGYLAYAILMSLLIFQKMSFKKALLGILLLFSTIALIYTLSPVMKARTQELVQEIKLFQQHQEFSSLGLRIQFHQYAESLFKERPIVGIGTGGFKYRFSKDQPVPEWGPSLNEPHGQYWLTLAEQGLIGIILLFLFLGVLYTTALKLNESKPLLIGMVVAFCILSSSDTILCYSPIGYLLIIFSALCFGELIQNTHQ